VRDYFIGEKISLRVKIDNRRSAKISASMFKIELIQNAKIHVKSFQCEFEVCSCFLSVANRCAGQKDPIRQLMIVLCDDTTKETISFKGFKLEQNSTGEKTFHLQIPEEALNLFPTTTGLFVTISHRVRVAGMSRVGIATNERK
jgi:hypothetical protein